jgi:nitrate reductase gamma subunit
MTLIVYLSLYAGLLLFVAGVTVRTVRYARARTHLRWELYPVPHEAPARAAHGGSYFEVADWWTRKRHFSLRGELNTMVPEMVYLKALREANRRLWRVSFPFHMGLYLLIGASVLLVANALFGPATAPYGALALAAIYKWMGIVGTIAVIVGATGLLVRRLSPELRNYTTPADLFNLACFIGTVTVIGLGYWLRPAGASMIEMVRGLLLFDTRVEVPHLLGAGLMMAAALLAYIPTTHMAHFMAKFFTYHLVRWDDAPNRRGSRLEARIRQHLALRPTWSAPHIGADGKKTWAEIAMLNPTQEVRK